MTRKEERLPDGPTRIDRQDADESVKTTSPGHSPLAGFEVIIYGRFSGAHRGNRKQCFIVYFIFDCLMVNGNDLRNEPLIFRKGVLKRILKKSPRIRYTDHIVQEGKELFITVEKLGLEGIVGKKADSRYVGGRTKEWVKIKTHVGTEVMKKRVETWGR